MIYRIDVTITAPVHPTEVTDRVETAITNIFPEATLAHEPDRIVATSHSLDTLSELLHRREILDTARSAFFGGRAGDKFSFRLKKQAAWVGVVTFAVGDPPELGDIDVTVVVHEPTVEELIDHVAPRTVDGVPIRSAEDG